jgi:hypothetical protein
MKYCSGERRAKRLMLELCGSKNFVSVSVPILLEQKNLGSVIFKKEEQCKCMNSFMYVSSIFTK